MKILALNQITLFGYYGRQNTGDDAMLYGLLTLLVAALPKAIVNVPTNSDICIPPQARDQVRFFPRKLFPILIKIVSSDALIIGGGTVIHDYSKRFRYFWATLRILCLILWARFFGKQVHMVGIGFGPFTSKFGILLGTLISRLVHHVTVRDSNSLEFLKKIGMPSSKFNATFDLACILEPETEIIKRSTSNLVLGISVLPYFYGYTNDSSRDWVLAEVIADALNQWLDSEPSGEVCLLPFLGRVEGDGDLLVLRKIQRRIKDANRVTLIPYSPDPRDLINNVRKCKAIIAMRYHAAVYAYTAQRPMVVIDYHPKCSTFANDIGLSSSAILTMENLMSGKLLNCIKKLIASPEHFLGNLNLAEARSRTRLALPPELRA